MPGSVIGPGDKMASKIGKKKKKKKKLLHLLGLYSDDIQDSWLSGQ